MKKKIGRNDLCRCGSGRKAKNCCGARAVSRAARPGILTSGWTIATFLVFCIAGLGALWYFNQAGVDLRTIPPPLSSIPSTGSSAATAETLPPGTSLVEKTSYTEIPGVDLTGLSVEKKTRILDRTNVEKCPCGCGLTIAGCRHLDTSCGTSLPMAKQIVAEIEGL